MLIDRRHFLLTAGSAAAAYTASAATRPPNVVVIYCDDLGYGDVGCYGSPIPTPNLDRMASEGVRFTHFNSANPVCSPSRAALLTGRYPTRTGVERVLFPYDKTGLPESETTIAQMLKQKSYQTMCVGKWHLGHLPQFLPTSRGFDEYFGIPYSNDMEPPVLLRNREVAEARANMDTLSGQYTREAVGFIERSKQSPFFLYLAHSMPHIPLGAGKRFKGKSPFGLYGDVIEEIDWSVGEVLTTLKRNGLDNDTLVLFSSDNGPWFQGSPGKLRGRKGMVWEGGVREPFIARLPGRIPAGRTCASLSSTLDVLPTVAALTGAPLPKNPLDGQDMWPLLSGQKNEIERDVLLYFDGWNLQCARWGKWKLHVGRYNTVTYSPNPPGGRQSYQLLKPELYDVTRDLDESYDQAALFPEVVEKIRARIGALVPSFPEEVRKAWAEQKARANVEERTGALPHGPSQTAADPARPK